MALSNDYSWEKFKKTTKIKGKSRGKNMELVDDALKSYWEGVQRRAASGVELANLLAVVKATNTWFKKKKAKKDANVAGDRKVKAHFITRWNALVDLGKAALAEAKRLAGQLGDANAAAALAYESKKRHAMGKQGGPTLRPLQGTYANERALYVGSGKAGDPVSGTTVHEIQDKVEGGNFRKWLPKYGHVFTKSFDELTTADFQTFEQFMTELEQADTNRQPFKHHVRFLRKADRLAHIATVENGRLVKSDGQAWDTGGQQYLYAMDEYANLFVMPAGALNGNTLRTNHSSILAGKDVLCAGEVIIAGGILTYIANSSGHYKPGQNNLYIALSELWEEGLLIGRTVCDIMVTDASGWRGVSASDLIKAEGNLSQNHPSAFGF